MKVQAKKIRVLQSMSRSTWETEPSPNRSARARVAVAALSAIRSGEKGMCESSPATKKSSMMQPTTTIGRK